MKKYIKEIIAGTVIITFLIFININNNKTFEEYFDNYKVSVCTTVDRTSRTMASGSQYFIRYYYKVDKVWYKGKYSLDNNQVIKYPKCEYYIVYSEKDPRYNAFIPIEVNKLLNNELDTSFVKKCFINTKKASHVRRRK